MTDLAAVEAAIASLRPAFNADGADLVVVDVSDSSVAVDLVLGPETCLDCIVSTDTLEGIISATVRSVGPNIKTIRVNDPRAATY